MTNPVIDGLADGCSVVGSILGDVEGRAVGVDVINTGFKSRVHWSLNKFSNSSIELSILSELVASTTNEISANTPNDGFTIISTKHYINQF